MWINGKNICLVCTRPWVPSLTWQKEDRQKEIVYFSIHLWSQPTPPTPPLGNSEKESEWAPGQPGLHRKTLPQINRKQNSKQKWEYLLWMFRRISASLWVWWVAVKPGNSWQIAHQRCISLGKSLSLGKEEQRARKMPMSPWCADFLDQPSSGVRYFWLYELINLLVAQGFLQVKDEAY